MGVDARQRLLNLERLGDVVHAPSANPFTLSAASSMALIKITGMSRVRSSAFNRTRTSHPFMSGIMIMLLIELYFSTSVNAPRSLQKNRTLNREAMFDGVNTAAALRLA